MYASLKDIVDRYGEAALLVVASQDYGETIDSEKVERALTDASDEINGYVGKRYPLPLEKIPGLLKRLAVDIAIYRLSIDNADTEERRKRYEDAVKVLNNLVLGNISLGLPADTNTDTSPTPGEVEVESQERLFKRKHLNRVL